MNLIVTKEFRELTCARCGCLFALTEHFMDSRRDDHGSFYCPMGHSNIFPGKSEAEKLREELAKEISRRSTAEHEKEKVEKKLNRVANGVCPDCNRSFTNIRRHMKTKHKK